MMMLDKKYYKEERRLLRKAKEEGKLMVFVGAGASLPILCSEMFQIKPYADKLIFL